MKEKILALLLAVTALTVSGCGMDIGVIGGEDGPTEVIVSGPGVSETVQLPEEEPAGTEPAAEEEPEEPVLLDEDVSLYLYTYDHLPDNYITKDEARELGWTGGSVEQVAPGCAIGGDRFGNREGLLPKAGGRQYYECDIDTIGENSRGAKRMVWSNDVLMYYTEDP